MWTVYGSNCCGLCMEVTAVNVLCMEVTAECTVYGSNCYGLCMEVTAVNVLCMEVTAVDVLCMAVTAVNVLCMEETAMDCVWKYLLWTVYRSNCCGLCMGSNCCECTVYGSNCCECTVYGSNCCGLCMEVTAVNVLCMEVTAVNVLCMEVTAMDCVWKFGSALRKASVEGYANIYSRTYCMNFMCDTKTNGGGWIVIQRRVYRTLTSTEPGRNTNMALVQSVTTTGWETRIFTCFNGSVYELRIDMEFRSVRYFAEYREFYIDSESDKYKLHLNNFTGNVKDEFIPHSGMKFSTPDSDNDLSNGFCAGPIHTTGWWFRNCHFVSLNGHFHKAGTFGASVIWESLYRL
ncbi:Ryncolin-4 [Bulinus truncatus]|nr:Ryncolin-4 [Bulinus truncatus]